MADCTFLAGHGTKGREVTLSSDSRRGGCRWPRLVSANNHTHSCNRTLSPCRMTRRKQESLVDPLVSSLVAGSVRSHTNYTANRGPKSSPLSWAFQFGRSRTMKPASLFQQSYYLASLQPPVRIRIGSEPEVGRSLPGVEPNATTNRSIGTEHIGQEVPCARAVYLFSKARAVVVACNGTLHLPFPHRVRADCRGAIGNCDSERWEGSDRCRVLVGATLDEGPPAAPGARSEQAIRVSGVRLEDVQLNIAGPTTEDSQGSCSTSRL